MVTIRNAPAHCSLQSMSQATGRPATPPHDCLLGSAGPAADGSWLIRQRCTRHEKRLRQEYHIQRSTCFDAGNGYKGESTHTTLPTAGWSAISEQRAECQKESWPCLQLSTTTWRPSTTNKVWKPPKKWINWLGARARRYNEKNQTMETITANMKEQHLLLEDAETKLELFGNFPQEILEGWSKKATEQPQGKWYREEMKFPFWSVIILLVCMNIHAHYLLSLV